MSGLVSRGSVLGKKALLVGTVIAGLAGVTVAGSYLFWPSRPADAPMDTSESSVGVQRHPPRREQAEPAVSSPPPQQVAYTYQRQAETQRSEERQHSSDVSGEITADLSDSFTKPQQTASNEPERLHEPYGQRHGSSVGHVTFKPLQMEGQEAGVVDDLSHTIKPTTQATLVLDQALDSSLPGPLVAHFDTDVRPWDNSWPPLIPKGTRVLGSYQPLDVGQRRMGGISAQAYLSDGRIVPLGGAPFTDDLGRMGIPGQIDNRFWERFGNAILVDAAFALIRLPGQALNSRQPGNTNINMDFGNAETVVSQVMNSTVNLKPILKKNQGDRIGLLFVQPIRVPEVRLEIAR